MVLLFLFFLFYSFYFEEWGMWGYEYNVMLGKIYLDIFMGLYCL